MASRRTNVVFGEGNPLSPLVLVGEGPGETEDLTGRPFVGRAGQLLDQALEEAGVGRANVYITNTVKCRAADWQGSKAINRAPTDAEAAACRRWLDPQLAILKPQVILCVGAPSAKNLIKPDFKITRERGLVFESPRARAILATLHPAYILRQRNMGGDGGYKEFVSDIRKAWGLAHKYVEETAVKVIQPSLF
ncbi:MAG: uracil-DNA glycosylase [Armatimonadetes bacterium]|nr:uracil-DNA glycosylase [Armatimonadota bacterium]